MFSIKRLENIYKIYEEKYEIFSLTEELSSKKDFEYMTGYFARVSVSETMSDDSLAFNFLDSENRSMTRLNTAMNRLTSAGEWLKDDVMVHIDKYMREFEYQIRRPDQPSYEAMQEAYEDLKMLEDMKNIMREKAMSDAEYRKALIELFLVGTSDDQALLKDILSPTGFDE